jgi:hypothetical protein
MPTLFEVMEDDDFLPDLRQNNDLLMKYLSSNKIIEMVKLVVTEPTFNSSPARCFKLPFVATQALCVDTPFIAAAVMDDERVLNALFEFINLPEEVQLNSTLCGYFNKILSFWLIKKPG